MRVTFEMQTPPKEAGADTEPSPVEYVVVRTGRDGSDEVRRRATDADRTAYAVEYAAFKASQGTPDVQPVAPADKPPAPAEKRQRKDSPKK